MFKRKRVGRLQPCAVRGRTLTRKTVGRHLDDLAGVDLEHRHRLGQALRLFLQRARAAASSTSAAFCCVTSSICDTARFTWSMPLDCSSDAAEISPMMSVTRLTDATISCIVAPARSTCCEPAPTLPTESSIRPLISLAACALRCASERTSPATTAKLLFCSPARAASTAAFSARMLVWNAMPSITDTISEILRELAEMPCIVVTTSDTAEPPRSATSDALAAS